MAKTYSNTLETTSTNIEVEIAFDIPRGTETIYINDDLLTTTAVAQARAESMFLEQSYTHKMISFDTYHIDGVEIGQIISVNSVLYCVESIEYKISGAMAEMKISAKRWE